MYDDTIDGFVKAGNAKLALLRRAPLGFFVGCMLAGAYIGLGIILILTLGSHAPPDLRPLVMGTAFGIALILVVIAGAELFTGHTLVMALRRYRDQGSWAEAASVLGVSWVGNLCGAAVLAGLFALGGGGGLLDDPRGLLMDAAAHKMNGAAASLFARAVLCNWLVCLAVWMSARVSSDSARCIVISWCLLAFVASGYEHSVANMTLLLLALIGHHPDTVSLGGMAWNLAWVTLGNIVGGAVFVAGAYRAASPAPVPVPLPTPSPTLSPASLAGHALAPASPPGATAGRETGTQPILDAPAARP
ncbi:Formate efflux transporter [Castellaniella defragrans 65Phen]|uniref:Formate efflux transporter n=1 Tax=Castellaniella defragrans (strain DSM 12143 / CCUG 39792 / 65Phen) TaxID=1437824 RepID=W8XA72_CASD6|nr:formate/nitrite transporter family protein [Castellaniella defragrans]CDM26070.1 Formate efflux transporter [Castellaniella defragrans 65Phen]